MMNTSSDLIHDVTYPYSVYIWVPLFDSNVRGIVYLLYCYLEKYVGLLMDTYDAQLDEDMINRAYYITAIEYHESSYAI